MMFDGPCHHGKSQVAAVLLTGFAPPVVDYRRVQQTAHAYCLFVLLVKLQRICSDTVSDSVNNAGHNVAGCKQGPTLSQLLTFIAVRQQ